MPSYYAKLKQTSKIDWNQLHVYFNISTLLIPTPNLAKKEDGARNYLKKDQSLVEI